MVHRGRILDGRPDSDLGVASPRAEGDSLRAPQAGPDAFCRHRESNRPVVGDLGPVSPSTLLGCVDRRGRGPTIPTTGSECNRNATLALPGAIPGPPRGSGPANLRRIPVA